MRLKHAIERGKDIIESGEYEGDPWDRPALELLIEAGKEILRLTEAQQCHRPRTLPGQTKE